MNSSPNRSAKSSGKPKNKGPLDLSTAREMLPLIRSIVSDIVGAKQQLHALASERDRLDRNRRQLEWTERERRYNIGDELSSLEKNFSTAINELEVLGLTLVDPEAGEVDFPTRINGRSAAFSWRLGEDGVKYWHYEEEELRRPIPSEWPNNDQLRHRSKP